MDFNILATNLKKQSNNTDKLKLEFIEDPFLYYDEMKRGGR